MVKLSGDWAVCARCGSAEGLDAGRHCLQKWGFRRCEDICWIKANTSKQDKGASIHQDFHSTLQHTKVCAEPGVVVPGVCFPFMAVFAWPSVWLVAYFSGVGSSCWRD